jgi:cell division inhibitor SepF
MGIFNKLRDFVGFNESMDYEYEYDEMDGQEYQDLYQDDAVAAPVQEEENRSRRLRNRSSLVSTDTATVNPVNNVIGMPGAANGISEVVVIEPRTFEEMPQVIQALRERKSVVLNLTVMDPDQAQRAVDFVAGGTFAIDGHQERIGESIFLFTPSCVQVSTQAGIVNEISQAPVMRSVRPSTTSAPAWTAEPMRMVQ